MKLSKIFFPTTKEIPKNANMISHKLMIKAGMIHQLQTGIYNWLPIGTIILNKIINIIKCEMNKINSQEIIMPMIQPTDLLYKSNRLEKYGNDLFFIIDRNNKKLCLSPTHEEVVTKLIQNKINSHKQLPILLYQIQQKFRDELRPKNGLIRCREFIMKDGYSFHSNNICLNNTYKKIKKLYENIFKIFNLNFIIVKANSGDMGGSISHEYHILNTNGDDNIIINNKDYTNIENIKNKKHIKTQLIKKGIEIAHIFKLNNFYTKKFKLNITDKEQQQKNILMGCYGIGVSRLLAAIIEQNHDNKGVILPKILAPFHVAITPINYNKSNVTKTYTNKIYNFLKNKNVEVLLDDRNKRFGESQYDIDLIGIPYKLIINEKKEIEFKKRNDKTWQRIKQNQIINLIK